MDAVKSYVMCALLAAALSGILKNISSGMKNFEKYVGLVCSLTVIIILASPLAGIISNVRDTLSSDGSLIENIQKDPSDSKNAEEIMSDKVKRALEDTIKDILCRRFALDTSDIEVSALLADDNTVQKIVINIYTDTDTLALKSYVENIMCISAEIRSETRK